ncbi:hypothetical protein HY546_02635 [archaeon]|nr:hypothetical protein [archaeon]
MRYALAFTGVALVIVLAACVSQPAQPPTAPDGGLSPGESIVIPTNGSQSAGTQESAANESQNASVGESGVVSVVELSVAADDYGFRPDSVNVTAGSDLTINFAVSSERVYFGGLEIRGGGKSSGAIGPGRNGTVLWQNVSQSFQISSYWPSSNTLKATMQVNVLPAGRSLSRILWEVEIVKA